MKQYKAVAGPKNINVGRGNTQEAFNLFAEIINREAQAGWEYHSMKTISVTEKPGCLRKTVSSAYYMLIFSKEVQGMAVTPLPEQTPVPPASDTEHRITARQGEQRETSYSGTTGEQGRIKKYVGMFVAFAAVIAIALLVFKNIKSTVTESSIAEIGDTVLFGSYEQDNDTGNGAEAIEWLVLDKQDGKLLLLSKAALDCKTYNEKWEAVTWETCTLRDWLNGIFYNTAFSMEEQGRIVTTKVKNEDNPKHGTDGGNDKGDKVFLLSIGEVNRYLDSDSRCARATVYAEIQGIAADSKGNAWWWLRSPGFNNSSAAYVTHGGDLLVNGGLVSSGGGGVRPAFWLNPES